MPKSTLRSASRSVLELRKGLEGLREALYQLPLKGDTSWTSPFKSVIAHFGRRYGYQVWGTIARRRGWNQAYGLLRKQFPRVYRMTEDAIFACGEWLFDICWADCRFNDWRELRGLYLACECEWSRNERATIDDFLKLIAADAEIKVFVFACHKLDQVKERMDRLQGLASKACSSKAKFLVIAVPDGGPFSAAETAKLRREFTQGKA